VAGIDPKFYYLTLGLLGLCTLVGLIVAYSLQREVNEDLAPPTERDLLGPLEKAYYSGLMREEEFKKIQESMAKQAGAESTTVKPRTTALRVRPANIETGPSPDLDAPPVTPTDDSGQGPAPG